MCDPENAPPERIIQPPTEVRARLLDLSEPLRFSVTDWPKYDDFLHGLYIAMAKSTKVVTVLFEFHSAASCMVGLRKGQKSKLHNESEGRPHADQLRAQRPLPSTSCPTVQ
jgi:hypothetical protein